jgi:hypothetical protein
MSILVLPNVQRLLPKLSLLLGRENQYRLKSRPVNQTDVSGRFWVVPSDVPFMNDVEKSTTIAARCAIRSRISSHDLLSAVTKPIAGGTTSRLGDRVSATVEMPVALVIAFVSHSTIGVCAGVPAP